MAVRLLNGEVADLCLGKPELICVAANSTISDALTTLKASGDTHVSVWVCSGESADDGSCWCVGKFSVADVILFLCREENLADPFKALESLVSDLLPKGSPIVRHLEPNSSLWEAIDYIIEGTQNLAIPLHNHPTNNSRKKLRNKHHHGHVYCWLTQEDVARYLFNSIGVFSPTPAHSIKSLNIIDHDIMTILYNKPASSALPYLHRSLNEQKPVAIIDEENHLIGEISPFTLSCCHETAAAAIMALSAMDLMAHIDWPLDLVHLVKVKLKERNLVGMVELMDELCLTSSGSSSSCSSDDESFCSRNSCRSRQSSARWSEPIACGPGSSLAAVMIQALVNRVSSVWVVDEDQALVGIVTVAGILKVFHGVALEKNV